MINRVLVANRGEIAVRVIKAAQDLGIEAVLAVSEVDRDSMGAQIADKVVTIGPSMSKMSYLNPDLIVHAALSTNCDAIHPGYGFLSERPVLPTMCVDNNLIFVGPNAETIQALGNKITARDLARRSGIPLVPGTDSVSNIASAIESANGIGFPVLVKAAAGGGGKGMFVASCEDDLKVSFDSSITAAEESFGDGSLYLERYIEVARHVEVQIAGDGCGKAVHFGDRDCSVQRRYQKMIEEGPCTIIPRAVQIDMRKDAVSLVSDLNYGNVGTVEFVYDVDRCEYYFIEVNTRIQVEHPVSEQVSGHDLIKLQFHLAEKGSSALPTQESIRIEQHSIECRIIAEDPENGFLPSPGVIVDWEVPNGAGVRVDSHIFKGYCVSPFYDSLLGKLIITAATREKAIDRTLSALNDFKIEGIKTNINLLTNIISHQDFKNNRHGTKWLENSFLEKER